MATGPSTSKNGTKMIKKSQAELVISTLGLVDLEQVPGPAAGPGEGTVTTAQILDVVEKLRDPTTYGGNIDVARAVGVETGTVLIIRLVMDERIAELTGP